MTAVLHGDKNVFYVQTILLYAFHSFLPQRKTKKKYARLRHFFTAENRPLVLPPLKHKKKIVSLKNCIIRIQRQPGYRYGKALIDTIHKVQRKRQKTQKNSSSALCSKLDERVGQTPAPRSPYACAWCLSMFSLHRYDVLTLIEKNTSMNISGV